MSSSPPTPVTRALPVVLRDALAADPAAATMAIYTTGAALPAGAEANRYVNVVQQGVTVKIPKLSGARVVVGAPAYVIAWGDFMLYLGTVQTT